MQQKIQNIRLFRYRLPLSRPLHFTSGPVRFREGLLIQAMSESGLAGWGEAAPLEGFSTETMPEAEADLRSLRWSLIGHMLADVRSDASYSDLPSVRFAVESAAVAMEAKAREVRLPEMFASTFQPVVQVNALVSLADDSWESQLLRFTEEEYECVKLKTHSLSPDDLVYRVQEAVAQTGKKIRFRLDANRTWEYDEAVAIISRLPWDRIDYVEEPLTTPEDLERLVKQTGARIALDESLRDRPASWRVSIEKAAAYIIKPMLIGAPWASVSLIKEAQMRGAAAVISSSIESGIATRMNIALASVSGPTPAGLDPYNNLERDILDPYLQVGANVHCSDVFDDSRRIQERDLTEI